MHIYSLWVISSECVCFCV